MSIHFIPVEETHNHTLDEGESLLLKAKESFIENGTSYSPGDTWLIHGPTVYIPSAQVEIVETRKKIFLKEDEGIYIRDVTTGHVRAFLGETYLLTPSEELWHKEVPEEVEEVLAKERSDGTSRDKTRVIKYQALENTAVHISDHERLTSRVVFGPKLIFLGPHENFTVLSLSGDEPKRPDVIKTIALELGPGQTSDIIPIETSDHARMSLTVTYHWKFDFKKNHQEEAHQLFRVPDFIGEFCKALAARITRVIANVSFDDFNKSSTELIRGAIFGPPHCTSLRFASNNLVITGVDIQSIEPVDQKTRHAFQKLVQHAIEMATRAQEEAARQEVERRTKEGNE